MNYGDYECDKCGACCQGHAIVEAGAIDVMREPRLSERHLGEKAPTIGKMLRDDTKFISLAVIGTPCGFLGRENLCQIYPTRPNVCVFTQAGDDLCQGSRQSAGLPPLAKRKK